MRLPGIVKSLALFFAIVAALLAVPLLFPPEGGRRGDESAEGAPWQIEPLGGGEARVFGLVPGRSTLQDARRRFGPDVQVALLVAPGEAGSLEAYYESLNAGPVRGKMILTLATSPAQRKEMLGRARKAEYMEGATRRVELAASDLAAAADLPVDAIAFIPTAALDEQVVLQRFGAPAERIRGGAHAEHFLYPDKGLDLRLDAKGREVLQYVAPRDFARLRDPLVAAARP